jgi:hypothetical protein
MDSYVLFKGLYDVWKKRNYDLYFYFQEIFDRALDAATKRAQDSGLQLFHEGAAKYQALFTPVGFSIENVALITGILRPNYLRFAFTETTKRFHLKHIHLVEEKLKTKIPNIKINSVEIRRDDQKDIESRIVEWINEMGKGYGLSYQALAVDLTGGTKPMSIGAHNAALSFDEVDAFYLKTEYDEESQMTIPGTETLMRLIKGKAQVDKDLLFVMMPFAAGYDKLYQWIEETAKNRNLKCLRADREIFDGGIMSRIKENILKSGILIADLTQRNPNVYYELGFSHCASKKVIMLTQSIDNIPFDLKHLRMVIYRPDDETEFKTQLGREIDYMKSLE